MAALTPDQKKKAYVLGALAGLLGLIGIVVWHPWSQGSAVEDASAAPVAGVPAAPRTAGAPGSPSAPSATGSGTANPAPTTPVTLAAAGGLPKIPIIKESPSLAIPQGRRPDPFAPEMIVPTPEPYHAPPPTPLPPVVLPQPVGALPVILPTINGAGGSTSSGGLLSKSPLLVELPPIHIHRMSDRATQPSDLPPRRPDQGTSTALPASPNKRISGVVIGDTVRALIEISDGDQVVTRVVQPGDEIEGIKILRVERVREGDRLVTRMIVREGGEERRVDLKPSPNPASGGEGGSGGSSGGYPGGGSSSGGGRSTGGYPGGRPGGFRGGGGYPGGGFRPPQPPGF